MPLGELLHHMVDMGASDLHIKAGSPPGIRVHGKLVPVEGAERLTAEACRQLLEEMADPKRLELFDEQRDLDFSKHLEGVARFRINLFHQRNSCAAVLRMIPIDTPTLEEMAFPDVVRELCHKPRGLILVTGPTGSGKSTTLAAMIDYINRIEHGHILTLEDPIEFIHQDKQCYVNQREMGADSLSFSNALRAALREDPDFILVGEMRDLETISLAITAAETGHLVFGTLHTTSAIQTVDRVIDVFPHEAQQQVRTQLSLTLQAVISQTLLPKIGGGRACAQEVMVGNDGVRNCIREGKTPQLINMLQTGGQLGMQTLESCMERMVLDGIVRPEDAIAKANNPVWLRTALERDGAIAEVPKEDPGKRGGAGGPRPTTKTLAERFAQAAGLGKSGGGAPPPPRPEPAPASATAAPAATAADDFEKFRAMRQGR